MLVDARVEATAQHDQRAHRSTTPPTKTPAALVSDAITPSASAPNAPARSKHMLAAPTTLARWFSGTPMRASVIAPG